MEKLGKDAFHTTSVHGENGTKCIQINKCPWRNWDKMYSTQQVSMEKVGQDAFKLTSVHGESGARCIPHNKCPWRKWDKMHSN